MGTNVVRQSFVPLTVSSPIIQDLITNAEANATPEDKSVWERGRQGQLPVSLSGVLHYEAQPGVWKDADIGYFPSEPSMSAPFVEGANLPDVAPGETVNGVVIADNLAVMRPDQNDWLVRNTDGVASDSWGNAHTLQAVP